MELAKVVAGKAPFADLIALGTNRIRLTLFFQRQFVELEQMADSL